MQLIDQLGWFYFGEDLYRQKVVILELNHIRDQLLVYVQLNQTQLTDQIGLSVDFRYFLSINRANNTCEYDHTHWHHKSQLSSDGLYKSSLSAP